MPSFAFAQVDVFTEVALSGNPVAVVFGADGIQTARMQAFCDWTNLSEVTFLLPPKNSAADYAVRIFSPGRELPFAGHPTLGTAHAWLEAGGRPQRSGVVVQECGAGLIDVRRQADGGLAFAAPPRSRSGPLSPAELDRVVRVLGIDPAAVVAHEWCDNGPGWQAVLLSSAADVLAIRPDGGFTEGIDIGVAGRHPAGGPADLEVRAFFSGNGGTLLEDPVTGSLNAALGQWLIGNGQMPKRYVARQGTALGRNGLVMVEQVDGETWVGGHSVTVLTGEARI